MHDPQPLRRPALRVLLGALLLLLTGAPAHPEPEAQLLRLEKDDTALAGAYRIARGVYRIADAGAPGVIRITTDGTSVDLRGVTLIGADETTPADAYEGSAIEVIGARNVTIRGGRLRGFQVAVRARDAPGLTLEDIDASENRRQRLKSTPAAEDGADWLWPHENDKDEWETRYGAGFSLTGCARARVSGCRVRDGQNGLLLTGCERAQVFDNNFSFNSGWGIALYRSNRCVVAHNRCDWCVRGYSHGVYHRGQDSAGILVFEQSSYNLFVRNSATHGGDGFFLYAGHETTQRTGTGGCDGNLVFENDFRFAVANGIEATFSTGNVFVRNDCSGCDHGIWAGYSADSLFYGNEIHDCLTAGISIEHGQENRLFHNEITGAPTGIHLWWDLDEAFVQGVFGAQRRTSSQDNVLHGNRIAGVETGIRLVGDTGTTLRWNLLGGRRTLLHLGGETTLGPVTHNLFTGARRDGIEPPLLLRNDTETPWRVPETNRRRGRLAGTDGLDPMELPSDALFVRPAPRWPRTPPVPGTSRARLSPGMPAGRAEIRIGSWGPLDPRLPHVTPTRIQARGRRATVHLSGRGRYALDEVSGRVRVRSPLMGPLPATIEIEAAADETGAPASAWIPFSFRVHLGVRSETVRGSLLDARWDLRSFRWSQDPRTEPAAFAALLAQPPLRRAEVDAIDETWGAQGPPGVGTDRFATLATTRLWLEAGRYRLRTVSDDGVRVAVDGVRVLENWTHHGPTEDVAEVTLTRGWHEIRIEHFELDGWAVLRFDLARLP